MNVALKSIKLKNSFLSSGENNIAKIHENKIFEIYKAFLVEHERNSRNTALNYDKRIREFFQILLGEDIEFITEENIKSIQSVDVKNKYVNVLYENGNTNNTIRTKLQSIKSFYNELLSNGISVNPSVLKVKMKVNPKHHEAMLEDEIEQLLEFMKSEKDGVEKYLLTKMLYYTAGRKTATLNIKWSDIKRVQDVDTGKMVYVIQSVMKGQQHKNIPVSDEFIEELQVLNRGQEYIFDTLNGGGYKRYERSLKKFGDMIGKDISIHSLKSSSITNSYRKTKDIELCRQLGSHKSISTTEIYVHEQKSLTKQLSYKLSSNIDETIYDKMSGEELKEFIDKHQDLKMAIIMRLSE